MSGRKIKTRKSVWFETPFIVGVVATLLIFIFFAYVLSHFPVTTSNGVLASKWDFLKNAKPNEIGDAFAGVAGSLAFVWLFVTVWFQAIELREQRSEFEKMAEAQAEQVKLLVLQGEIFEEEQRQRRIAEHEGYLKDDLQTLGSMLEDAWIESNRNTLLLGGFFAPLRGQLDSPKILPQISRNASLLAQQLKEGDVESFSFIGRPEIDALGEIFDVVSRINGYSQELSSSMRSRIRHHRLRELEENLKAIMEAGASNIPSDSQGDSP